jgi:hypothetical protein
VAAEPSKPDPQPKDRADQLIEHGQVLVKIGNLLKPLKDEDRIKVIRAAAAFYGFDVERV